MVAGVASGVSTSSYSSSTVALWDFSDEVSASLEDSGSMCAVVAGCGVVDGRSVLPFTTIVCASENSMERSFCSRPGSSP